MRADNRGGPETAFINTAEMRQERRGGWCADPSDTQPWLQVYMYFEKNQIQNSLTNANKLHTYDRICFILVTSVTGEKVRTISILQQLFT